MQGLIDRTAHDPGQIEEWGTQDGYHLRHMQLEPGPFEGRFTATVVGSTMLERVRFNRALHIFGTVAADVVTVAVPLAAGGPCWFWGVELGSAFALVMGAGREVDLRTPSDLELVALLVPRPWLLELARRFGFAAGERLGSETVRLPWKPGGMELLRAAVLAPFHSPVVPGPDSWAREAALYAGLFGALSPEPKPLEPEGRAAVAQRARASIEEHLDREVRIEELSASAGVGVRTLQRSFQEVYGMSPMSYLKIRRLDNVRRALRRAAPGSLTVTDAALAAGFTHFGRFGQDYKAMYGERPSATLRGG